MESRCNANAEKSSRKISASQSVCSIELASSCSKWIWCMRLYYVAAYVDQNPASSVFQDFNCGQNTYDGHRGTDIAIGPFPFYMMEHSQVEVIAAADGIMWTNTMVRATEIVWVQGADLQQTRLCCNTPMVHERFTLTWKQILWQQKYRDAVSSGEYLGVVEVPAVPVVHIFILKYGQEQHEYTCGSFSGSCNLLNANSWWATQKPYTETEVIKASVHTTDISFFSMSNHRNSEWEWHFFNSFSGVGLAPGYMGSFTFSYVIQ